MSRQSPPRICKSCQSTDIFRVARHGFLQKDIFSLFGLYPWECPHCRQINLIRDRGGKYRSTGQATSSAAFPAQPARDPVPEE